MGVEASRRALCVAVLLAAGSCGAAHAAETGFYIGVGAGQSDYDVASADPIAVAITGPFGGGIFSVPPATMQVEDDGVSWSAILGYRIHTYVAAELAYMSFGEADVTEVFPVRAFGPSSPPIIMLTQRTRMSVTGPAVSLLGILPIGAGWQAYLRGGVLFADQEIELVSPPSSLGKMTFGSEEWLAGAGIQWTFGSRWGVRLEYQRIGTIESNLRTGETDLDQISLTGTLAL